jgi:hypothetical protein
MVAHTAGLVVCEEKYLEAMRELQAEADQGRPARRDGGWAYGIVSMDPLGKQKYAYCEYCEQCELVVVRRADVIPDQLIPDIAK